MLHQNEVSQYKLSRELEPRHAGDVKAVISIGENRIASASRDCSVAVWTRNNKGTYAIEGLLDGHHAYVNSLAYIPSSSDHKEEILASGGNSSLILLHDLSKLTSDPLDCLVGHSLNVCTLAYSPKSGHLMSGSWDHTARVWTRVDRQWESVLLLDGHDEAVWGVAIIDEGPKEGCFLTGSADRLIDLWSGSGELMLRIKGSPEPVRSLALAPGGKTFVSACNDGLIRVWDFTGGILQILRGHTEYVYDVVLKDDWILSCGEDHTARIWKAGQAEDVLLHPCQTVWTVATLPNGDIVTGGSDGCVRVWSMDFARIAESYVLKTYDAGIKLAMSRTNFEEPRGQETSASAETVVIDIDISDDAPPIALSYTVGDDPRKVAEEFGRLHALSESYVNQIEAFIKAQIGMDQ